jgi:hypothetical protein
MKSVLFILCLGTACHAFAEIPGAQAEVTVRSVQGGQVDVSRYFILKFNYSPLAQYCSVDTLIIANTQCTNRSIDSIRGFWLQHEHASKEYSGSRFSCALKRLSKDRWELVFDIPVDLSGKISHRLVLRDAPVLLRQVLDYSGNLSKYSNVTDRLESASFVVISQGSMTGFSSVELGCSRMIAPVISK